MKHFKSIIASVLILSFLLASGCSSQRSGRRHDDRQEDRTEDTEETDNDSTDTEEYDTSFGSFEVTHGWVYVPSQSNDEAYCFCEAGNEDSRTPPNNIVVRHGDNFYGIDEHNTFAEAIMEQITDQAAQYGGEAYQDDIFEVNGSICHRFVLDCTPYTEQVYIVGDHEFVMIGMAIYDEDAAESDHVREVAEDILNSFEW